jgi:hypothetical protein
MSQVGFTFHTQTLSSQQKSKNPSVDVLLCCLRSQKLPQLVQQYRAFQQEGVHLKQIEEGYLALVEREINMELLRYHLLRLSSIVKQGVENRDRLDPSALQFIVEIANEVQRHEQHLQTSIIWTHNEIKRLGSQLQKLQQQQDMQLKLQRAALACLHPTVIGSDSQTALKDIKLENLSLLQAENLKHLRDVVDAVRQMGQDSLKDSNFTLQFPLIQCKYLEELQRKSHECLEIHQAGAFTTMKDTVRHGSVSASGLPDELNALSLLALLNGQQTKQHAQLVALQQALHDDDVLVLQHYHPPDGPPEPDGQQRLARELLKSVSASASDDESQHGSGAVKEGIRRSQVHRLALSACIEVISLKLTQLGC